jgi:hypothetical protein
LRDADPGRNAAGLSVDTDREALLGIDGH